MSIRLRRPARYGTMLATAAAIAALAAGLAAVATHTTPSSAALAPVAVPKSSADSAPATSSWRGEVVWAEHQRSLSVAQTVQALRSAEFGATDVRNGVDIYRIVYRTPGANGRPTTASGLLAVPRTPQRTLRLVSFAHGTVSYRPDAPSSLPDDLFASAPAIAYAGGGFASVAPDYLGLGLGPGTHPWFDVRSETTASLDLLRAARTFLRGEDRDVDRGVIVTGFSQGASAALGLGRALQQYGDPYFRLRALAPVSGAYDFRSEELPALLHGQVAPPNDVAYTSYLLVAYNRLHHLYRDPAEVFREPYADRVATLFNGNTPGADMISALPQTLDQLLTPRGQALLTHPSGAFAAALSEADSVCRWQPHAPVRLYYAEGDEQAVNGNTASCSAELRERGVPVRSVDLGTPDSEQSRHLGSAVAGTAATLRWFRTLT